MLDKELLLKDLCARLPYGVMATSYVKVDGFIVQGKISSTYPFGEGTVNIGMVIVPIEKIKPYLRPMSSMTEDERVDFRVIGGVMSYNLQNDSWAISAFTPEAYDWLNAHHFDYRGLIEKGLAIEAPDGMYNLNEK